MAVEFITVTPRKTRWVKITSATRAMGKHLPEGAKVCIEESEAYLLVHSGKAEFTTEPARPEKAK